VAANSERKCLHRLLIRPTTIAIRNCGELRENGLTQLNRVLPPLAIINFNALDLVKGYPALDIADDQAT
jgi:hypothetical protein